MRKKLLILFICFAILPITIIYSVTTIIFNNKIESNLKTLYTKDIQNIQQIADNYFSESLDLTMYPLIESNLYQFFTASSGSTDFPAIQEHAYSILSSSPYILGGVRCVSLMRTDGTELTARSNSLYDSTILAKDIENLDKNSGKAYWDYNVGNSQFGNASDQITVIRLIRNKIDLSQKLGYVKVAVSKYELLNNIRNAVLDNNSDYFIVDENSNVILATNDAFPHNEVLKTYGLSKLSSLASQDECTISDGQYFISAQKIDRTPFLICSIIQPDVYSKMKSTLMNVSTLVVVLTSLFFIVLALTFSKSVVKPMRKLGQKMYAIAGENFSVRASVKGNDEIAILTNEFNSMAEHLEFLYKEVYQHEIELKQAQLIALQSQINPHFLYNTMDTIYWMSETGDTKNLSLIVSNMSKLLRLTFSPNNCDFVPLEDELEHLNYYINIQKIRYDSSLEFQIECDPDLKDIRVLKLLLQPLVENALVHGLDTVEHIRIVVRIYRSGNFLIYEVMNNGTPIDTEEISAILNSKESKIKGLAIRNIDKRVKLKYGDDYGLEFYLKDGVSVFKIRQLIDPSGEPRRSS
ncbi:MAG: sensor histidine kinase [Clostridiales bacterium]|nr:sensor histidine kinase [Clostridiales bacterium]